MSKPGYTESVSPSAERTKIRDAGKIAEQLAKGKLLSPESTAQARDAFADLLWTDAAGAEIAARTGIIALYGRTTDPADEAVLIGELVAAGKRAAKTFDEILQTRPPRSLSPTEVNMLRQSLDEPPAERLGILTRWLSRQGGRQDTPSRNDVPRDLGPVDVADPPKSRTESRAKESTPPDGGPDPESAAESVLSDHSIPEQERLEFARQVGPPAVTALTRMLHGDNVDRDFANTALSLLAASPTAAKKIFDAARKLEIEAPGLRATMEPIRRHAEHTLTGRGSPGRLPPGARDAQIRDGILSRALSMCDSPSILRASAGRESLAIPLVLRQLARLRAAQ
jgi:hypothetical protein